MKQTCIAIFVTMCVFFNSAFVFADSESIGIIPGKLAWSVDSIVEQWTLTKDVDSDSMEQTLFEFATRRSDDDRNSTPLDKRYNRQLVITLSFINLGSETYRFDNSSQLEASVTSGSKTISADAQPKVSKTIIAPNGRIKKSSFVLKMNNRAFIEAFDNRTSINDLSFSLTSGKLLIEDSKGNSLLDNVKQPGIISFHTDKYVRDIYVFPEPGNEFTLKDALLAFNTMNNILTEGNTLYKDIITITDNQIDSVFGIPTNKTSSYIGSNVELPWLVVFMYNENPVDNSKTADVLSKPFHSKDEFNIGVIPTDMLNEYLPLDKTFLLPIFSKCIEKLPESVAPKRYQEVNIKCYENLVNPYKILKGYAESGDNEAVRVIIKDYNPKAREGFLFELFPTPKSFFLWLKPLANKGDVHAQLTIGFFYNNGVIVKENPDKALKYYKMAADQDNDEAMVYYAQLLYRKDKEKYHDEVEEWFRKAAERKNPGGQYMLALLLLTSQDDEQTKEGLLWLQQSAFQGEPDAIFTLALEYYFGRLLPRDDKKAFTLMEKAALEKGSIKAIDVLGDFYMRGVGVEPDGKRAVLCYSIGAQKGVPNSMYWYGRFLCDGFNVEKDVPKGYALIKEAATKGNSEAMLFLGLDFYIGKIAKKSDNDAFIWIEKAAKAGNGSALVVLGDFYMDGVGVKADKAKAVELYKLSASQKDALGVFRLGQVLYEEKGADAQTGLNLIKDAAKMGCKSAKEYLEKLDNLNNSVDDLDESNDDNDSSSKTDDVPDDDIEDLDEEDPFE
ncbi:MAG: sel1 repeat family protein [Thermoguttaceae bacterium]|nr:sel1 repeat family protein [Thermoguttaceae bacterium]